MASLSVNVDHVATLRQARGGIEPDPVTAAAMAELAGAQGVIMHLREDRRHVQDRDVELIRKTVKTKLNFEMAATPEMIRIARDIKPWLSTLVPEKRQELTTEGGLNVKAQKSYLKESLAALHEAGVLVSLFVDAELEQIEASKEVGADFVEIHTGHYADAVTESEANRLFDGIRKSISDAHAMGLRVNVGHGLNYVNILRFSGIKEIEEYAIGHSIISRAVLIGMDRAVRDMVAIVRSL